MCFVFALLLTVKCFDLMMIIFFWSNVIFILKEDTGNPRIFMLCRQERS
jgi:hypothetical protein